MLAMGLGSLLSGAHSNSVWKDTSGLKGGSKGQMVLTRARTSLFSCLLFSMSGFYTRSHY